MALPPLTERAPALVFIGGFEPLIAADIHAYLAGNPRLAARIEVATPDTNETITDDALVILGPQAASADCAIPASATRLYIQPATANGAIADREARVLKAPLHLEQLGEQVESWLSARAQPSVALSPDWVWLSDMRELQHRGGQAPINLTEKENALLACLIEYAPNPIERDALLATVWGYSEAIDTHTLETHIYRLRQKLEPVTAQGKPAIETDAQGYRFVSFSFES